MCEPGRLTTSGAFTACYWDSFAFYHLPFPFSVGTWRNLTNSMDAEMQRETTDVPKNENRVCTKVGLLVNRSIAYLWAHCVWQWTFLGFCIFTWQERACPTVVSFFAIVRSVERVGRSSRYVGLTHNLTTLSGKAPVVRISSFVRS
jgi:hypothetical protein